MNNADDIRHNTLDLVLKVKWYEMIASGEKREEYREIKPYWVRRLLVLPKDKKHVEATSRSVKDAIRDGALIRRFDFVRFHRAYTSTTMTFAVGGIDVSVGNTLWGATDGVEYFVIRLGERIV